jgi:uncharacterized protein (DUF697 family)/tellurite resistance protein
MTTTLTQPEQEALLTIGLMAAFADGGKSDVERAEIKRLTDTLPDASANPAALYQRVLLRQVAVADAAALLARLELRQLAYEMAVCVCEADDTLNEAENEFLGNLRTALGLEGQSTLAFQQQAEAVAHPPLIADTGATPGIPPRLATGGVDAEVDRMVKNCAILNGALELLPDTLATVAIVPLQMNMVYRIGKLYGYELDRGHIRELLATAGVGLTSQVLEGFARKLIGGLLGKVGGGIGRGVGRHAASSAMAFACTYALGQMARKYYAGGRRLSAVELKELFASFSGQARSLHGHFEQQIQDRARLLKVSELVDLVRRQAATV